MPESTLMASSQLESPGLERKLKRDSGHHWIGKTWCFTIFLVCSYSAVLNRRCVSIPSWWIPFDANLSRAYKLHVRKSEWFVSTPLCRMSIVLICHWLTSWRWQRRLPKFVRLKMAFRMADCRCCFMVWCTRVMVVSRCFKCVGCGVLDLLF